MPEGAGAVPTLPHAPDIGTVRDDLADNVLLAGLAAVADRGPLPIAAATTIPLLALMLRRRFEE